MSNPSAGTTLDKSIAGLICAGIYTVLQLCCIGCSFTLHTPSTAFNQTATTASNQKATSARSQGATAQHCRDTAHGHTCAENTDRQTAWPCPAANTQQLHVRARVQTQLPLHNCTETTTYSTACTCCLMGNDARNMMPLEHNVWEQTTYAVTVTPKRVPSSACFCCFSHSTPEGGSTPTPTPISPLS